MTQSRPARRAVRNTPNRCVLGFSARRVGRRAERFAARPAAAPRGRSPRGLKPPGYFVIVSVRIFPLTRTFVSVRSVTPSTTSSFATLSNAQSTMRTSRMGVWV
jgi:hypothetical protein